MAQVPLFFNGHPGGFADDSEELASPVNHISASGDAFDYLANGLLSGSLPFLDATSGLAVPSFQQPQPPNRLPSFDTVFGYPISGSNAPFTYRDILGFGTPQPPSLFQHPAFQNSQIVSDSTSSRAFPVTSATNPSAAPAYLNSAPPRLSPPAWTAAPFSPLSAINTNSPSEPTANLGSAVEASATDEHNRTLAQAGFAPPSFLPLGHGVYPIPPVSQVQNNFPQSFDIGEDMPTAAASRPRRASRASAAGVVDLTKEEPAELLQGIDPTTPSMATTRKRSAAAAAAVAAASATAGSSSNSKRRRDSQASVTRPVKTQRHNSPEAAGAGRAKSPFASSLFGGSPAPADDTDVIDLSEATEVPKELLEPKVDNRIKLGHFQCVICMDDVTNLAVTHCGHLFCSECLHSALHIDHSKKTCPVCRTKVELKDRKSKNAKSFYHLELKLMTAKSKGKQVAR